ncbi:MULTISPECIES: ABC transporter substrate-binding protein [Cohnella]|uniref:ABC transporter substrate-binding protein n=1 Tax=Cohnella TaxID=329857 RepID=UPI001118779F|nr:MULTISPECIES: ABC transporter substrate-binding protein [Cohnella]MBN2984572.1 ABC transporter substrate-binding protein [Cohnella algarum]
MNVSMKKLRLFAALAAALLVLNGCGGAPRQAAPDSPSGEAKPAELTVLLDWYPNAVHSFLFAAKEQGYFEEAGLDVKLQTPADTNDALKLVAAGKADLAISYQMQVAISRSEDIPVVSVASIVRHPLNRLFVLESAGANSPKDLAGKKIGYPSIPLDESLVETMVASDGGDPSGLTFVDIGWDLIPAMTTGRVDAIVGGYINHEKLLLEKEGVKLLAFDPADYGVPDYYELVLTASEEGAKKNKDAIKRFLEAAAKGQAYVAGHPDEALEALLAEESADFPLDPEIERESLDILLPLMDAGQEPFGSQSAEAWQAVIDWLSQQGHLSKPIEAEEAFVRLE